MILLARILEQVAISVPGHLPYPGIKPGSPELQVDSLPVGQLGNPNNNNSSTNLTLRKKTRRSSQVLILQINKIVRVLFKYEFLMKTTFIADFKML